MDHDVQIRPLGEAEVDACNALAWSALQIHIPVEHMPGDEDARARRGRARIAHLLATDPGGAWVAVRGDEPVGVALALVREDVWGLSLLAVAPDQQERGIGGALLAAALAYGADTQGGIILSSVDPRAMRRYALAGFSLHPCVCAAGTVDHTALPAGLTARAGDVDLDRETCDRASRTARGASHGADLQALLGDDGDLLVIPGHGFAVRRDGSIPLLAATDEGAATDLLWSALARVPRGMSAHVDFITAGQGWAIDVLLRAGLALSVEGPVFVRGAVGPMRPYLPSGAYL
jgi:GNAT superfamily N-acetyltransferase